MYLLEVSPRFGDLDGLRHVNNTVIPGWFEQARNPIYRVFNPEFDLESWNLILARFEIDFIRQIYFNKNVVIKTWISRIGRSSFEIYQEAVQEGLLCAKGKVVHVHFDFNNQKSIEIPAYIKSEMEKHLYTGELK